MPTRQTVPVAESEPQQGKATERKRTEEFTVRYANNAYLEPSAWDLKLIFGQLDQSADPGKDLVLQHSAITMPWPQVKMLAYLLQVHLAMHENQMGRVVVPSGLIFRVSKEMPDDFKQQFKENHEALWQKLRDLYENFIAENPEAE